MAQLTSVHVDANQIKNHKHIEFYIGYICFNTRNKRQLAYLTVR